MKKKVFLGGTCNGSLWRGDLIPKLTINHFDPVVEDWNEEAYQKELHERATCDYCLYVLTPMSHSPYSIAEVVDDSNKRPEKTVFCIKPEDGDHKYSDGEYKHLKKVGKMVEANGGLFVEAFDQLPEVLV